MLDIAVAYCEKTKDFQEIEYLFDGAENLATQLEKLKKEVFESNPSFSINEVSYVWVFQNLANLNALEHFLQSNNIKPEINKSQRIIILADHRWPTNCLVLPLCVEEESSKAIIELKKWDNSQSGELIEQLNKIPLALDLMYGYVKTVQDKSKINKYIAKLKNSSLRKEIKDRNIKIIFHLLEEIVGNFSENCKAILSISSFFKKTKLLKLLLMPKGCDEKALDEMLDTLEAYCLIKKIDNNYLEINPLTQLFFSAKLNKTGLYSFKAMVIDRYFNKDNDEKNILLSVLIGNYIPLFAKGLSQEMAIYCFDNATDVMNFVFSDKNLGVRNSGEFINLIMHCGQLCMLNYEYKKAYSHFINISNLAIYLKEIQTIQSKKNDYYSDIYAVKYGTPDPSIYKILAPLGYALFWLGEFETAEKVLNTAWYICDTKESGDLWGGNRISSIVKIQCHLALTLRRLEQVDKAYRLIYMTYKNLKSYVKQFKYEKAQCLDVLGGTYLYMGKQYIEKAIRKLSTALTEITPFKEKNSLIEYAYIAAHCGNAQLAKGDFNEAGKMYKNSLDALEKLETPIGVAVLNALGYFHMTRAIYQLATMAPDTNSLNEAEKYYKQGIYIATNIQETNPHFIEMQLCLLLITILQKIIIDPGRKKNAEVKTENHISLKEIDEKISLINNDVKRLYDSSPAIRKFKLYFDNFCLNFKNMNDRDKILNLVIAIYEFFKDIYSEQNAVIGMFAIAIEVLKNSEVKLVLLVPVVEEIAIRIIKPWEGLSSFMRERQIPELKKTPGKLVNDPFYEKVLRVSWVNNAIIGSHLKYFVNPNIKANIFLEDESIKAAEYLDEFLSDKKSGVLLISGEVGSGKSTLCMRLERTLLEREALINSKLIPFRIELKQFRSEKIKIDTIIKKQFEFTKEELRKLKKEYFPVLILDGYNELEKREGKPLNLSEIITSSWKKTKIIITMQTQFLLKNKDYLNLFYAGLPVQEFQIMPFSLLQQRDYIYKYTEKNRVTRYIQEQYVKLLEHSAIQYEFRSNPFLLQCLVKIMVHKIGHVDKPLQLSVSKVELYLSYLRLLVEDCCRQLNSSGKVINELDIGQVFLQLKQIAWSMICVNKYYVSVNINNNFSYPDFANILSVRDGNISFVMPIYRDILAAIYLADEFSLDYRLNFSFLRGGLDPQFIDIDVTHPFNSTVKLNDFSELLNAFADLLKTNSTYYTEPNPTLLKLIQKSNKNKDFTILASNALTLINRMRSSLSGQKFNDCFLNYALLDDSILYNTQFNNSDLSEVSLRNSLIVGASFSKTKLSGVKFNKPQMIIYHEDKVTIISFSSDDAYIAWADTSGKVFVKNAKTLVTFFSRAFDSAICSLSFSKTNKYLAIACTDQSIVILRMENPNVQLPLIFKNSSFISSICFHPNEKYLAVASEDSTINIYDLSSKKPFRCLNEHLIAVKTIAFSPDGKYFASAGVGRIIRIWAVSSWECIGRLPGHKATINSVSFSADSRYLASGSSDKTVRLWDIEKLQIIKILEAHSDRLLLVQFRKNYLLTLCEGGVSYLWELNGRRCLLTPKIDYAITSINLSHDEKHIAYTYADKSVRIFTTDELNFTTQTDSHLDWIYSISIDDQKNLIATGSRDSTVRIWDASNGVLLTTLSEHSMPVMDLCFNLKTSQLASVSLDGKVKIWNTETWQVTDLLDTKEKLYVANYSSCGKWLSVGADSGAVYIFNGDDGSSVKLTEHYNSVLGVVFYENQGNEWFISGGEDCFVNIYNFKKTWQKKFDIKHDFPIRTLNISPCGQYLAVATNEPSLIIYKIDFNAASAKKMQHYTVTEKIFSIQFTTTEIIFAAGAKVFFAEYMVKMNYLAPKSIECHVDDIFDLKVMLAVDAFVTAGADCSLIFWKKINKVWIPIWRNNPLFALYEPKDLEQALFTQFSHNAANNITSVSNDNKFNYYNELLNTEEWYLGIFAEPGDTVDGVKKGSKDQLLWRAFSLRPRNAWRVHKIFDRKARSFEQLNDELGEQFNRPAFIIKLNQSPANVVAAIIDKNFHTMINEVESVVITRPSRISNLPSRLAYFQERTELTNIEEKINQHKYVVLHNQRNIGGVGKTSLAIEFAYESAKKNKYQIISGINDANNISLELTKLSQFLAIENSIHENEFELISDVTQALVKYDKSLLIIDNVEGRDAAEKYLLILEEMRCLEGERLHLLFIANSTEGFSSDVLINVPVLDQQNASKLIKAATELHNHTGQLAAQLNGYPLALGVALAQIDEEYDNSDPSNINLIKTYLTNLNSIEVPININEVSGAGEYNIVLYKVLYNLLKSKRFDKTVREIFFHMAYLDNSNIPKLILSKIFEKDSLDIALEKLSTLSLINLTANSNYFIMHRLISAMVRYIAKKHFQYNEKFVVNLLLHNVTNVLNSLDFVLSSRGYIGYLLKLLKQAKQLNMMDVLANYLHKYAENIKNYSNWKDLIELSEALLKNPPPRDIFRLESEIALRLELASCYYYCGEYEKDSENAIVVLKLCESADKLKDKAQLMVQASYVLSAAYRGLKQFISAHETIKNAFQIYHDNNLANVALLGKVELNKAALMAAEQTDLDLTIAIAQAALEKFIHANDIYYMQRCKIFLAQLILQRDKNPNEAESVVMGLRNGHVLPPRTLMREHFLYSKIATANRIPTSALYHARRASSIANSLQAMNNAEKIETVVAKLQWKIEQEAKLSGKEEKGKSNKLPNVESTKMLSSSPTKSVDDELNNSDFSAESCLSP